MGQLNQLIAVHGAVKERSKRKITNCYQELQKPDLFTGLVRTYSPKDEDGEELPPEEKRLQAAIAPIIERASEAWTELIDTTASIDETNRRASAAVAGVGTDIPTTTLIFLEKQVVDIRTFINSLPELPSTDEWHWDSGRGSFVSDTKKSVRTKKVVKPLILCEATKEHPAQVDKVSEDIPLGIWDTVKLHGGVSVDQKRKWLANCDEVMDRIKKAREQANTTEHQNVKLGEALLHAIFTK